MDERRLTELFRAAADEAADAAPPAAFDHADVLAGSRRAAERQRRRVIVASAAASVALAGAGLVAAAVLAGSTSTLAGPAPYAAAPSDATPPGFSAPYPAEPKMAPQQRAVPSAGCATPDAELFAQLADELPAVRGATPRAPSRGCQPGERGVEVDVVDGSARGVLRVVLAPSRAGGSSVQSRGSGSAVAVSVSTRSGGQLAVTVTSEAGPAPYAGRVHELARTLSARQ